MKYWEKVLCPRCKKVETLTRKKTQEEINSMPEKLKKFIGVCSNCGTREEENEITLLMGKHLAQKFSGSI